MNFRAKMAKNSKIFYPKIMSNFREKMKDWEQCV